MPAKTIRKKRMIRTYSKLIELPTFRERYRYLKLDGQVGYVTFGWSRYLNQAFYTSYEWLHFRDDIILRDNGCDLGLDGYDIEDRILIHHINPITKEDILNRSLVLFDPENVIATSYNTHRAIHYGDESLLQIDIVERRPNDTCPWRTK